MVIRPDFKSSLPILLICFLLTGCGEDRLALAPVSGTITLNGEPLIDASVTFTPVDVEGGVAPSSFGRTDAVGHYELQVVTTDEPGALIAKHKVSVTVLDDEEVDPSTNPDGGDAGSEAGERRVPLRYNHETELEFNVTKAGSTAADFALLSDPKSEAETE